MDCPSCGGRLDYDLHFGEDFCPTCEPEKGSGNKAYGKAGIGGGISGITRIKDIRNERNN